MVNGQARHNVRACGLRGRACGLRQRMLAPRLEHHGCQIAIFGTNGQHMGYMMLGSLPRK
eukprot:6460073-Amphidinium_carterae.1